jgi:hypothetical protein
MEPAEYLAFIPLLFYGMALAELLSQWRRFFDKDFLYWPYILTTIVFTEVAIFNVYLYLDVTEVLAGIGYYQYWRYLSQPIVFLLTVSALTPEAENRNTEAYFKQRLPIIFGLMAVFIASHLLPGLGNSVQVNPARIAAIAICLLIAFTRKVELVYVMTVVWLVSLFMRG